MIRFRHMGIKALTSLLLVVGVSCLVVGYALLSNVVVSTHNGTTAMNLIWTSSPSSMNGTEPLAENGPMAVNQPYLFGLKVQSSQEVKGASLQVDIHCNVTGLNATWTTLKANASGVLTNVILTVEGNHLIGYLEGPRTYASGYNQTISIEWVIHVPATWTVQFQVIGG